MPRITISSLENARSSPSNFAHALIGGDNSGGKQGFVQRWKSQIRAHHQKGQSYTETLKLLNDVLLNSFQQNLANETRTAKYCSSLKPYLDAFDHHNLTIDDYQKRILWEISPKWQLTGNTPFLCTNEKHKVAYFFQETQGNWSSQLKFPILQIYLADRYYGCEPSNVQVGIYSIYDNEFSLKTFDDYELDLAYEEVKAIFKNVSFEYNKLKSS